jgi:hypothetical protein
MPAAQETPLRGSKTSENDIYPPFFTPISSNPPNTMHIFHIITSNDLFCLLSHIYTPPVMVNALRYFPWDCLHIVRVLPNGHWFYTHYDYLTRTPTVQELSMRDAPEGLLNDEDYYDELELRLLVERIRAARDNIRDVHQQGSASKQTIPFFTQTQPAFEYMA